MICPLNFPPNKCRWPGDAGADVSSRLSLTTDTACDTGWRDKGSEAWGTWVTQCTEQWAMGDSLSDRLLQDLIHGYQDLAEDIGCLPILRWHAEDVYRAPTNESALDISKTFQPQILQKKKTLIEMHSENKQKVFPNLLIFASFSFLLLRILSLSFTLLQVFLENLKD